MRPETLIRGERTGLWYAWNGFHTVNIREVADGRDIDVYTFGDFAQESATYEEFVASVESHEAEVAV